MFQSYLGKFLSTWGALDVDSYQHVFSDKVWLCDAVFGNQVGFIFLDHLLPSCSSHISVSFCPFGVLLMSIPISMCFLTSFDVCGAVFGHQVGLKQRCEVCLFVYFVYHLLPSCYSHISVSFCPFGMLLMWISITMCFLTSFYVCDAALADQVGIKWCCKFLSFGLFFFIIFVIVFGHIAMSFASLMMFYTFIWIFCFCFCLNDIVLIHSYIQIKDDSPIHFFYAVFAHRMLKLLDEQFASIIWR